MQLASVLLAHPDKVEVIGATGVFGNTTLPHVMNNGRNILHLLNATHIPCYPGAAAPSSKKAQPPGDGAHGDDGIGNVSLPQSPARRETKYAVDYILETLRNNPEHTITISASGPLTNIAQAFRADPKTMARVKEIVIMGGCTEELDAADRDKEKGEKRKGNITYHAEFNFQQAPEDAKTVMESGLPIKLLPMNCTQQLSLTPSRKQSLWEKLKHEPLIGSKLIRMMSAPAALDEMKFHSSPFMHDVHCALYLLHPEEYTMKPGRVDVCTHDDEAAKFAENRYGRTDFTEDASSNLHVATGIKDPDKLFDIFAKSLASCRAETARNAVTNFRAHL